MWITLELNTSQEAATIKLYVKEKYQESIQKIEKELSRRLTFFKWHYPSCLVLRKWVMNLIKFSEEKTTFNFWYKTVSKANCFGRYSTISALRVAWNVTSPRPPPAPPSLVYNEQTKKLSKFYGDRNKFVWFSQNVINSYESFFTKSNAPKL